MSKSKPFGRRHRYHADRQGLPLERILGRWWRLRNRLRLLAQVFRGNIRLKTSPFRLEHRPYLFDATTGKITVIHGGAHSHFSSDWWKFDGKRWLLMEAQ